MELDTKNKHSMLKKHVCLMHASSNLSLLEYKISDVLLANALNQGEGTCLYSISVKELMLKIGFASRNYKYLKDKLSNIPEAKFKFNLLNDFLRDDQSWGREPLFDNIKIQNRVCEYTLFPELKKHIFEPRPYGLIDLNLLPLFKSKYGYLLYNNCARYLKIKQTPFIDISTFKELMGLGDDDYTIFRDLNSRVIKPAVKEINSLTPFEVKPEIKKKGASVIGIKFFITNKIVSDNNQLTRAQDEILKNLILEFGFQKTKAGLLIQQFEVDYIKSKISLVKETDAYKKNTIKNVASYLEKFLVDNIQAPKTAKDLKKTTEERSSKQREERELYMKYLSGRLVRDLDTIPANVKEDFVKNTEPGTKYYNTLFNPLSEEATFVNSEHFLDYIKRNHPKLLTKYPTMDVFLNGK